MDSKTLDGKIIDVLKGQSGTTRYITNRIFLVRTEKYYIIPSREKMQWVYSRLVGMKKAGKVVSDYPGYWRIVSA